MGGVTSGAHPFQVRLCPDCHRPMWQKHMEVCSGPAQRIAPPPVRDGGHECGCNTGGWHEPDCDWVTGLHGENV